MYVDPPATYEVQGSRDRTKVDNALQYVLDLLRAADQPRFALVIGDFGAGKTFLLHELARRMVQEKHPVWPVLVEMHRLEKQADLSALLAAHFTVADVPGYNFKAFQYMLNEGRIALLFDGFDELAGHLTYDTVTKHFETVLSATAGERAKVVLSSRRQYFLSDSQIKGGVQQAQIKLVLANEAAKVPGFRLVALDKFQPLQIRQYLRNVLGNDRQAEERYALINDVRDLLGLSENPRMLGFIVRIPEASLREAKRKEGTITAAKLYDLLVKDWLDFEHQRSLRISVRKGISREALSEGVGELALNMWLSRIKHVQHDQLRDVVAAAMQRLGEPPLHPDVLGHMFAAGSLLVRDGEGRFSFVHRSVLEWFVARDAAKQIQEHGDAALLAADELSALMADFFSAMATREKAISWARGKLGAHEKGTVAKNATLVLQRWGESLKRLDFAGQDLRGQDFSGVDWRGADLRGANLEGATLVGANLEGANLEGAKLYRANLTNANLAKAKLTNLDLRVTRLFNADLTRTEGLESAKLFRTNFAGANLPGGFDPAKVDSYGVRSVLRETVPMWAGSATACYCVAWDPGGELLAAGFGDGTVRLFDAQSGDLLRVLAGHTNTVSCVVFSANGQTIASGSHDNTLRLWHVNSGRSLRALEGHKSSVLSVAFSPNGQTIASGSHDSTLRLWDVNSGRPLLALEEHQDSVWSVAFSPNGQTIASGSDD
ncbi:MAG TPA: pentapeptide repeat-containing protein, partial [Polyangium sp.]|nr:pentapeptide repeat-containing protein [Polyangium sp.]